MTDRSKLQATYNDLLALQDQADTVPLATALDAVGLALSSLATARKALEEIAAGSSIPITTAKAALAAMEGSRC